LVYFFLFWYVEPRKILQPWSESGVARHPLLQTMEFINVEIKFTLNKNLLYIGKVP
jgi:hypothetical protein